MEVGSTMLLIATAETFSFDCTLSKLLLKLQKNSNHVLNNFIILEIKFNT